MLMPTILRKVILLSLPADFFCQAEIKKYDQICEEAYELAKKQTVTYNRAWLDSPWHGFFESRDPMFLPNTGVESSTLEHIGTCGR